MHKYNRHKILLEKIKENEFTRTKDLISFVSNNYNFTPITLRRDLKEIAIQGKIRLMHGGIKNLEKHYIINEPINITDNKKHLAEKTNALIQSNDILFISAGTINEYLIKQIDKPIHLFTNSIKIFEQATKNKNIIDIILTGGRYLSEHNIFVGRYSLSSLKHVRFNKCIINVNNISDINDLYTKNEDEAQIYSEILNSSTKKIIIVEQENINTIGLFKYGNLDKCDIVITDNVLLPNTN